MTLQDSENFQSELGFLHSSYKEERIKLEEKLRREVAAKDRQIENLEEQLSRLTSQDLRKLKRGEDYNNVSFRVNYLLLQIQTFYC